MSFSASGPACTKASQGGAIKDWSGAATGVGFSKGRCGAVQAEIISARLNAITLAVTPAKAAIPLRRWHESGMPACAGMTALFILMAAFSNNLGLQCNRRNQPAIVFFTAMRGTAIAEKPVFFRIGAKAEIGNQADPERPQPIN